MRHVPNEKSSPFSDMARLIKEKGYNKDVKLAFATVIDLSPLTVRLDGNGLETSRFTVMNHLLPRFEAVRIDFLDDTTGEREAVIHHDSTLNVGDRVAVIYDDEDPEGLTGFIIDKG